MDKVTEASQRAAASVAAIGAPATPRNSVMPYVWSTLILVLFGIVLIALVLFLRPQLDPLIVITSVFGFVVSISTGIAAFIKSEETHGSVNSQLAAWKREFYAMAHAEGALYGVASEQARVERIPPAPATAPPVVVIADDRRAVVRVPTPTPAAPATP